VLGEAATEEVLAAWGAGYWFLAAVLITREKTIYSDPAAVPGGWNDFDEAGLISTEWIAQHTPRAEAIYYLCGPRPFLRAYVGGLARIGIPLDRIRYEFFGPADELLAA
jgi:nitric oxide dioxygenase